MRLPRRALLSFVLVPALSLACTLAHAQGDRDGIAFFETKIRPVLVDRCYKCHSGQSAKPKGGLRLDSRASIQAGGDSGPVLIVKPAEDSLLFRAIAHADDVSPMPPKVKLPDTVVSDFKRWIDLGAPSPQSQADPAPRTPASSVDWWSLRPLDRPLVPVEAGSRSPIDAFIRSKLRSTGLSPNPEADRRSLIRRVTIDLTGIPPTSDEINAFVLDKHPDAYERLVDRLLASPHYGERWARHWMDAVHFAETHGHDQDRIRPNAWPYRDYLIQSFNRDTPYARFVREQVAGDVLFPAQPELTVALGFLASGPWDESSLRDIREDTIDRAAGRYLDRDDFVTTTMSTFVSLTVGCARCHDHKFDPISQREYYSLQAVFAGVDRAERAFDPDPQVAQLRKELTARRTAIAKRDPQTLSLLVAGKAQAEVAEWESRRTDPPVLWTPLTLDETHSQGGATLTKLPDASLLSSGVNPPQEKLKLSGRPGLSRVTAVRLEVLPDDRLPSKGPGRNSNGNLHVTEFQVLATKLDAPKSPPRTIPIKIATADFDQEGWGITSAVDGKPDTAWGIYPQVGKPHQAVFALAETVDVSKERLSFVIDQSHPAGHAIGKLRISVTDAPGSVQVSTLPDEIARIVAIRPASRTNEQKIELARFVVLRQLDTQIAALPPLQLVYAAAYDFAPDGSHKPAGTPRPVHLLRRGDIRNPGVLVKPGSLGCLSALTSDFPIPKDAPEGVRRIALANWLASNDNPLTWRSLVNRVWHHHFGRGLVDTPNDFGRMGSLPSHPELLDWLAAEFRDRGGSIKELHRLILLSETYQQSSDTQSAGMKLDSDNRLLWRQNRRRLDAETVRDAVLLASGRLDRKMGGPSIQQFALRPGVHVTPVVDYSAFDWNTPGSGRRSVYRFLFRTLPDPFMDALDSADASQLIPARNESLSSLQALALLNNEFILHHASILGEIAGTSHDDSAIQVLYRRVLGRDPTPMETTDWIPYLRKQGPASIARLLINTNEFLFVD